MIDRIYGNLWNEGELLQADGSVYKGKLHKKRRLIESEDPTTGEKKNFYSRFRF